MKRWLVVCGFLVAPKLMAKTIHTIFPASQIYPFLSMQSHTQHQVSSVSETPALCQLSQAFENEFYFVDAEGQRVSRFEVTRENPFTFGLVLAMEANFNMQYSLSCTLQDGRAAQSPKVTYVVGANGPADPNIQVLSYYGAAGTWKVRPRVGEDFQLFFPTAD